MVRAVQILAYDTIICGNSYKERISRSGSQGKEQPQRFLPWWLLFKLRYFAGDDIILLVGNGIELFIVLMHDLTQQGT